MSCDSGQQVTEGVQGISRSFPDLFVCCLELFVDVDLVGTLEILNFGSQGRIEDGDGFRYSFACQPLPVEFDGTVV